MLVGTPKTVSKHLKGQVLLVSTKCDDRVASYPDVTRLSLAFRTRLCAKTEAAGED